MHEDRQVGEVGHRESAGQEHPVELRRGGRHAGRPSGQLEAEERAHRGVRVVDTDRDTGIEEEIGELLTPLGEQVEPVVQEQVLDRRRPHLVSVARAERAGVPGAEPIEDHRSKLISRHLRGPAEDPAPKGDARRDEPFFLRRNDSCQGEAVPEGLGGGPEPLLRAGRREEPEGDRQVDGDQPGETVDAGGSEARGGEDQDAGDRVLPVHGGRHEGSSHRRPENEGQERGGS